jgi:hypothetical protein
MAWDGRYKLITGFDLKYVRKKDADPVNPAPILFDLENDPLENRNIAERAPDVVKRLRQAIA